MTQLTAEPRGVLLEEVVTRWIEHGGRPLGDLLPAFRHPAVHLDGRFTRAPAFAHPTWVAHGRVTPRRRVRRRGIRVELTVTAWSDDVAEINVRRSGRRLLASTPTREHRYFEDAHRVADDVAATLARGGMLTM